MSSPLEVSVFEEPKMSRGRAIIRMGNVAGVRPIAQVFGPGDGEIHTHSHPDEDGYWFVLSGKAKFYDRHDEVIAERGPHQALLMPHGFPYWFENAGDTNMSLLRVAAKVDPKSESSTPDCFDYDKPEVTRGRVMVSLGSSKSIRGDIYVMGLEGETNPHAYGKDQFLMVLDGAAAFYDEDDQCISQVQANESVVVPRGLKHWFESADPDKALEILLVSVTPLKVSKD